MDQAYNIYSNLARVMDSVALTMRAQTSTQVFYKVFSEVRDNARNKIVFSSSPSALRSFKAK